MSRYDKILDKISNSPNAIVVPRHKPVKEIYVKNAIKLILQIRGEK